MSNRAPVAGASKNPLIGPAGRLEMIFMESRVVRSGALQLRQARRAVGSSESSSSSASFDGLASLSSSRGIDTGASCVVLSDCA
jgi:hypothetical protein